MSLLARITRWLRYAAMLALALMMLVTIVDVTMRVSINELVLGSVEIVQLTLVAVVFLALPETFLRDEHITVDALDQVVSPATLRWVRLVASLSSLLLVAVMAWRMLLPALDTLAIGDLTSDLQLSLFWYWLPMLVGGAAAVIALVFVVLRNRNADAR
jgi:TRAP-type C4-dicarboxylate transport system permease small subunit